MKTAAAVGTVLRILDRACAVAYVGFTVYVGVRLVEAALAHTLWLLVLIVPVLVSAVLLVPSLYRNPELGLRLVWPLRGFAAKPRPRLGSKAADAAAKRTGCGAFGGVRADTERRYKTLM